MRGVGYDEKLLQEVEHFLEIVMVVYRQPGAIRLDYSLSAAPLGSFGRLEFTFRPFTYNLHGLSDIGTFTFCATDVERFSVGTITGAFIGICLAFREYRAVIKVLEKAGRNSDGRLATQMVEKEIAQFKITEINLVANEI